MGDGPCDTGYTQVGTKCWKLLTDQKNYLDSIKAYNSEGAYLASISSESEQVQAFSMAGSERKYLTWLKPNNKKLTEYLKPQAEPGRIWPGGRVR